MTNKNSTHKKVKILPKTKPEKKRWKLLHQYYSYTGFYKFVWDAVKKALPFIILAVVAIYVVNHYYDINAALVHLTKVLPAYGVMAFFFVSEILLGLVPPEIFIAWAGEMSHPWLYLTGLATLSYLGGMVSYYIGHIITKIPKIHLYLELKMAKQLRNSRKWGGFLIIVGALLPLPFSISCMAAGIIQFPFKSVALYGSLRFLRFLIYGIVIFSAF